MNSRIDTYITEALTAAFRCKKHEVKRRFKNFRKRLYNNRQSVFLLFQDYPLAGPKGRLPRGLALRKRDIREVAAQLALGGPPRDRGRFDRRRVLAAAEQVLLARWRESDTGRAWLDEVIEPALPDRVSASEWHIWRREVVEGGTSRRGGRSTSPRDEDIAGTGHHTRREDVAAWGDVLEGRSGQATLAPYLADHSIEVPSLLTRWHSDALARLPGRLRRLAVRMFRRMLRSPGFLSRLILDDPNTRPDIDDDAADDNWTTFIHRRYRMRTAVGESAKERFDAYLDTLRKAIELEEQIAAYEEASKNRDIVTRVTGSVASSERDRLFTGFNTPMAPQVLIVTAVGQEGIDLHRECRHVIHHDLPWNPATLEQRTGRVDRIGSKTERLRGNGNGDCSLDVAVPYIAGTYDEHRFPRSTRSRSHLRGHDGREVRRGRPQNRARRDGGRKPRRRLWRGRGGLGADPGDYRGGPSTAS